LVVPRVLTVTFPVLPRLANLRKKRRKIEPRNRDKGNVRLEIHKFTPTMDSLFIISILRQYSTRSQYYCIAGDNGTAPAWNRRKEYVIVRAFYAAGEWSCSSFGFGWLM
jgi:hypothetical protein